MEDRMRVMPHNTDAEKSILGAILLDNELGKEIIPELKSEDFYLASHKEIFDKISELYHTSKEIDLVTLSDKLASGGVLENVGGMEYLIELSDFLPSAANFKFYLEIVKRDSVRRKLIRECQQSIQDAFEMEDTRTLVASVEKNIFDLSVSDQRAKPVPISETMVQVIENFNEYAKNDGKLRGITTGFRDLDEMLNGLNRSDLVLVAARPAAGKTSFAMNIVENAACAGYTCAVFSLEMPKVQISQRMICSNAEVSMKKAFQGKLTDKDWESLMMAQTRLNDTKIFVDDTASITPADMQSKCRSLKAQHGLDLVMVDYIQLMNSGSKREQNRQLEIAEISRSLKLIARELNVPVVALSQLSRQVENRTPPIPQLSDLRDSGAIEQDADVIMFIHNPSAVNKGGEEGGTIAGGGNGETRQIMIAKHRNGQCGIVELGWRGEFTKFVNRQEVGSEMYKAPEKVVDKEAEAARANAYAEAEALRNERRNQRENASFGDAEETEYDVPDYALPPDELLVAPPPEDAFGDFVKEMPEVQIDEDTISGLDDELDF
ncbi:MAG: replicative DNA helicase [Bacillota bacterium]